jgi:hypothetical protein
LPPASPASARQDRARYKHATSDLNQPAYAIQISRDWNAKYNQHKRGYVRKFEVRNSFLDQ